MNHFNSISLTLMLVFGVLLSIFIPLIFYRWWNREFNDPAKLYRQLRRIRRISKARHQVIMQQAAVVDPKRPKRQRIDWLLACRQLVDHSA